MRANSGHSPWYGHVHSWSPAGSLTQASTPAHQDAYRAATPGVSRAGSFTHPFAAGVGTPRSLPLAVLQHHSVQASPPVQRYGITGDRTARLPQQVEALRGSVGIANVATSSVRAASPVTRMASGVMNSSMCSPAQSPAALKPRVWMATPTRHQVSGTPFRDGRPPREVLRDCSNFAQPKFHDCATKVDAFPSKQCSFASPAKMTRDISLAQAPDGPPAHSNSPRVFRHGPGVCSVDGVGQTLPSDSTASISSVEFIAASPPRRVVDSRLRHVPEARAQRSSPCLTHRFGEWQRLGDGTKTLQSGGANVGDPGRSTSDRFLPFAFGQALPCTQSACAADCIYSDDPAQAVAVARASDTNKLEDVPMMDGHRLTAEEGMRFQAQGSSEKENQHVQGAVEDAASSNFVLVDDNMRTAGALKSSSRAEPATATDAPQNAAFDNVCLGGPAQINGAKELQGRCIQSGRSSDPSKVVDDTVCAVGRRSFCHTDLEISAAHRAMVDRTGAAPAPLSARAPPRSASAGAIEDKPSARSRSVRPGRPPGPPPPLRPGKAPGAPPAGIANDKSARGSAGIRCRSAADTPLGVRLYARQCYRSHGYATVFDDGAPQDLSFINKLVRQHQLRRASPNSTPARRSGGGGICVFDTRRALGIELAICQMRMSLETLGCLLRSLDFDQNELIAEDLERLIGKMPTDEESHLLAEYYDCPDKLRLLERKVLPLSRVPHAERRLSLLHIASMHSTKCSEVSERLGLMASAASEILESGKLHEIFRAALGIMNCINGEAAKAFPASAFDTFAKFKLGDVPMMECLRQTLHFDSDTILDLKSQLQHVREAARGSMAEIRKDIRSFEGFVSEAKKHIVAEENAAARARVETLVETLVAESASLSALDSETQRRVSQAQCFLGEREGALPIPEDFFGQVAQLVQQLGDTVQASKATVVKAEAADEVARSPVLAGVQIDVSPRALFAADN